MTFATIDLEIGKEDAHEVISESVDGLRAKSVNGSIEYRNTGGMLLAILSNADGRNGVNATLRYQTSVIAPFLAHGRVKAREIRTAVEDYRIPN
ncbi:hypothetical protein [Haladaptatus sp. CMAA 1911]|uniref:hypothetical protein n=1 Tax=unclassified Haladaptatus TaxID=2622732 RepID=UPI003754316F